MNADFADVRSIMQDAGTALMGIGRAAGDNRAQEAAKAAISSPLLELAIDGAKGVLFNITGGPSLGMFEIDEAAKVITRSIDNDAKVKFGAVIDESMGDDVRITVIATGFDEANKRPTPMMMNEPEPKRSFAEPKIFQPASPPMEVRKPLFNPAPSQPVQPAPKPTPPPQENNNNNNDNPDDELDIPAFIRKKMK